MAPPGGGLWQPQPRRPMGDKLMLVGGWILSLAGSALWLYGYFVPGSASLIEWAAVAPWWIAEFLPNKQCEIGLALSILGTVGTYWPRIKGDG